MGFLVGVVTEIEGDVAFLPVPIIRWRAGDELTFNFGPTQVAARNGIGPQLVWHPIEELDFAVGGAFSNRRFRLDDHGRKSRQGDPRCQPPPPDPRVGCDPIGRSVDGVGQDRSFPIYARIGFRPTRSMGLEIFGGVALGGELIVEEEGGDQIQTEEYDPAPIFGLRGHIRF